MGQPIRMFVQASGGDGDEDEGWRQNNNEVLTLMATANTPCLSVDQSSANQTKMFSSNTTSSAIPHYLLSAAQYQSIPASNPMTVWRALSGVWCCVWRVLLYLVSGVKSGVWLSIWCLVPYLVSWC